MTTAEKTLKWWNDYKEMNGSYPLIAEIEAQLQMAVDDEKLVKNCSIPVVVNRRELLIAFAAYMDKLDGFAPMPLNEEKIDEFLKSN